MMCGFHQAMEHRVNKFDNMYKKSIDLLSTRKILLQLTIFTLARIPCTPTHQVSRPFTGNGAATSQVLLIATLRDPKVTKQPLWVAPGINVQLGSEVMIEESVSAPGNSLLAATYHFQSQAGPRIGCVACGCSRKQPNFFGHHFRIYDLNARTTNYPAKLNNNQKNLI